MTTCVQTPRVYVNAGHDGMWLDTQYQSGKDRRSLRTHWPDNQAKTESFRFMRDLVSKNKTEINRKIYQHQPLASTRTYSWANTHTCAHTIWMNEWMKYTQVDLEFMTLLPRLSHCEDYSNGAPHMAISKILNLN